jgi:Lrp/AsnC family transcriptional regulator, regulator for asnA, asnC and gidA
VTGTTPGASELDDLDLRIIGQLQDDGRKPTVKIARALHVPRTTVARRIDRLVRDGIITIGAFANGPRVGLPIQAMILLQVAPIRYDAVIAAVVALDEVRWVGVLSGPHDLLIEAMLPSNEALRRLLLEKLAKIEGITQMQTAQVLQVAKIAFDWNRMLRANLASEPPPVPTSASTLTTRRNGSQAPAGRTNRSTDARRQPRPRRQPSKTPMELGHG